MKKSLRNIKFLFIWLINSITSVRLSTEFSPYAVAIICFVWIVALSKMLDVI